MVLRLLQNYWALIFVFGVQILAAPKTAAFELSLGNSLSSTSRTQTLSFSHRFLENQKVNLSMSSSKDTSIVTDGSASSVKGNYSYRFSDSGLSLKLGAKKSNDYYFYESLGSDVKFSLPVYEMEREAQSSLTTRLIFMVDSQSKQYLKLSNESFFQNSINFGVEQDLTTEWSVGLDSTFYFYSTNSKETTAAFQAKTTPFTDISDYVNQTSKTALGIDVEYAIDDFSAGLTLTKSIPQVAGQSSFTSFDIFIEHAFFETFTANLNFSRGRTEGSSTTSDSWGFGFGWSP